MKITSSVVFAASAILMSSAAQSAGNGYETWPPTGEGTSSSLSSLWQYHAYNTAGMASAGRSGPGRLQLRQGQTRKQLFDSLDTNGSGSISRSEAEAAPPLVVIFVESDTNSDNEISAAEFDRVLLLAPDGTTAP
jgi:hypothetical protein